MGFLKYFCRSKASTKVKGISTKDQVVFKKESHKPHRAQQLQNARQDFEEALDGSFKTSQTETNTTDRLSPRERTVDQFLIAMNHHASVEELLQFFTNDKVMVYFEDGMIMPAIHLLHEMQKVWASFENFKFSYFTIEEESDGRVLVEICASGTHSGAPYGFANFPPVPAAHLDVVLDEERLWFQLDEATGKICRWDVIALGNLTGPPGMYMAVGGTLRQPPVARKD